MPTAPATAKDLVALIVRSRLLGGDELKAAVGHLQPSGSDASDLEIVRRTLVAGELLTEYQAALLMRGHADGFFLGPYRVLDRIAKGRFAGVYKAKHESGQIVAIKVLPASKAKDPEVLARFKREARLLTRLDHPNVVRAFHLGEADGKHYLVLEYLEGDTLADVLANRKRLPPLDAVRIVHQALLGLQHIHEKGMIHRDLEPANLMLVGDEANPTVKVLDIGLGKAVFDEREKSAIDDPSRLTTDGVLIGTPDYLAPEQARSAKSADIRADIYSLGCVLYRALTGQPPFPDKLVLSTVMRHATEPPRPLADFLPDVPSGLQNVLNWMLAKDPGQRYATPEKAAAALNLFLNNTPPARAAAANPAYVKWLEESGELGTKPTAALPAHIPVGRLESAGRRPEPARPAEARRSGQVPIPPPAVPTAAPAPPPPRPAPAVAPLDIDVELVSIPLPAEADDRRGLLELNRRDVIMLCGGGAMVLGAILIGYGLSRALHKEPPPEPPEPNAPKEG